MKPGSICFEGFQLSPFHSLICIIFHEIGKNYGTNDTQNPSI